MCQYKCYVLTQRVQHNHTVTEVKAKCTVAYLCHAAFSHRRPSTMPRPLAGKDEPALCRHFAWRLGAYENAPWHKSAAMQS